MGDRQNETNNTSDKMTREEFDKAPLERRVYKVFEIGRELASREFLHCYIKLFAVGDFYAEVFYVPATNKIHKVDTLSLDEVLQIYHGQLDISGLLN
jgi:hypothetical protein